jgi:L-iditol 2-dehydrogenase
MRTAVYYSNTDIRIEEKPVPKIGPGEVLLKVMASGICGSDVMEWYRINRVPLILGHEIAGEIVETGLAVKKYKKGQRIAVAHHVPCGECRYCLSGHETVCETLRKTNFDPGGFCEFVRLPKINVEKGIFLLPKKVSYEEATFVEPLACVLRGQRIAKLQKGQTVLVMGSGIAGLLHIHLAKKSGAGLVMATDINDFRLKTASKFGADEIINAQEDVPSKVRQINNGRLADLVIICTGAPLAINQALKSVDRGGTILFFAPTSDGVTVPFNINELFWRTEITITSSYAGSPEDYAQALRLIAKGVVKVKDMITHRLALKDTGLGFKLVNEAKESIKVIIEPQK